MTTELLERDSQLSAMAGAHEEAARGRGSVVLVTGEPGIGKTSLVTRFAANLGTYGRVLWGTCDDLAVPRPLSPFRDFVAEVSEPLRRVLAGEAPASEAPWRLLEELSLPPRPVVVVLEDVHWADGATLDAVTYLGRRVGGLPVLLVLTFRDQEVPLDHPLHVTLSGVRASVSHHLELGPLSVEAVMALVDRGAHRVHELTGGNPFFVSELAGAPENLAASGVPPSVASAVAARTFRLSPEARRLVELVSVVPGRIAALILSRLITGWEQSAEYGERAGLLIVEADHVRFRHELARTAVRDELAASRRRLLHSEVLAVLVEIGANPADIVYHADGAGATDVVASHVIRAAREAVGAEAYREALRHYRRAVELADQMPKKAGPSLFEELATTAHLVGEIAIAMPAIERAIALNRQGGNTIAVGRCIRVRSRLLWNRGDISESETTAAEAIGLLEPLGDSVELAHSYNNMSTIAVLASDNGSGLDWGRRALDLARRLGDKKAEVQALINIGAARFYLDPGDTSTLVEAHESTDDLGERFEAQRALLCLAYGYLLWVRPKQGLVWTERYLTYTRRYGLSGQELIAMSLRARYHLREGRWDSAEKLVDLNLNNASDFVETTVRVTKAILAVRRGLSEASEILAEVGARADQMGDLMRHGQVLESEVEWALVTGGPMPLERADWVKETIEGLAGPVGAEGAVAAAWASVAGRRPELDEQMHPAYAAMCSGDWSAAADAFGTAGWIHDRALMLSLLDDERSLMEAFEIAAGVGADALVGRIRRRTRELGLPVPQGPRRSTRENLAGLTNRQMEVLEFVIEGLTNRQIADRLFVSPRTIDRHVEAILRKLEAGDRREAADHARELGFRRFRDSVVEDPT